jgi:hypothetical protein
MSKLEKAKERAKSLEAKDPKGAIEAWLEVLKLEEEGEANPDLSAYNRIGDLCLKIKDPARAADYYERAVDKYAELGFHNNAIAMCNKVLRNAPGRPTAYLKLAKLYASKGFTAEAKQNFVEYAERMQKAGKIQHAFAALKEFTDLSPEGGALRVMLEEHLAMYGAPDSGGADGVSVPAAKRAPPSENLGDTGSRKTSSLVFLDLDEPPAKGRAAAPPRPAPVPVREPAPLPEDELTDETPEPDTSLEIEATSLADESEPDVPSGAVEGLERTVDFREVRASAPDIPAIRDDEVPDDAAEPLPDLEPTTASGLETDEGGSGVLEPLVDDEIEIEAPPPPKRPAVTFPGGPPPQPTVTPVVPKRPGPAAPRPGLPQPPAGGAPPLKPVIPTRPGAPAPQKRKPVVEVPPLELEPDFEAASASSSAEVDDQPLAVEEERPARRFGRPEGDSPATSGRKSGFIDLGIDEVVNHGDQPGALVFTNIEEAPSGASIEDLEGRVADDPDDPEAHRALGEALIEAGDRDRGIEELDHAAAGLENRGALASAQDLTEEILRLDPNSVRHRQKQVEYAFKSGDKARLIDAYLELADTLLRGDLPDKARAVYQRVA